MAAATTTITTTTMTIHHVFANRSNVGDWLSAQGIQALLRPHPVVEHLCDEPFVPETLDALSSATPDDLIVIGGGGLFMDYFTPFWEGALPVVRRVPTAIWGVGYCDLKREPSRAPEALLAEVVRASRLCVLRDDLSRRHLSGADLPEPVPCPSLCAPSLREKGAPGGAVLHVDNYTTAGPDVFEAMDAAAARFAGETGRRYRRRNNRIEPPFEPALARVLDLYREADVVLSSALHGCIIAVALGRKVLAVSGDRKVEAFMEAAGLGEWVLDIGEVGRVPEALRRLDGQPRTNDFVERGRRRNAAVGRRVLDIAGLAPAAATEG